jgi:thiamine biosynthesis lipoprotein
MEALDQFHNVVKRFTRFNENSELSNLNRRSGEWTFVSSELYSLVQTMMQFSKDTSGAFDPTVIDFLEVYGYDANYDFSKLDNVDLDNIVKDIAKKRPGWQEIEMKKQGSDNLIKLAKGQRIDLGGLGKGYAIDLAYSALSSLSNFMINAGGDIRTKGVNEKGSAWSARLLHKDKNDELRTFSTMKLYDEALACSGSWAKKSKAVSSPDRY